MSELGDKEHRFVEDQRRITTRNSEALQFGQTQAPQYLVIRNKDSEDVVKVNFDGTLEYGEDYDPDEAARCFWEAISLWAGNRDALLAEAAAVLRAMRSQSVNLQCKECVATMKLWQARAKPLLDKLGERE